MVGDTANDDDDDDDDFAIALVDVVLDDNEGSNGNDGGSGIMALSFIINVVFVVSSLSLLCWFPKYVIFAFCCK